MTIRNMAFERPQRVILENDKIKLRVCEISSVTFYGYNYFSPTSLTPPSPRLVIINFVL